MSGRTISFLSKVSRFLSGDNGQGCQIPPSAPLILALEPRFMFDAAGAATGAEAMVEQAAQGAAEAALDAADSGTVDNGTGDTGATDQAGAAETEALVQALSQSEQQQQAENGIIPPPAVSAQTGKANEVVIIDSRVADQQTLLEGVKPSADAYVLDGSGDAIAQITDILSNYENLDALHIISHGDEGEVYLGDRTLSSDTLDQHAADLAAWGDALTETGDILLYGCLVASGDGEAFVQRFADTTGADVAASDDMTGAAELGGDWELEYSASPNALSSSGFVGVDTTSKSSSSEGPGYVRYSSFIESSATNISNYSSLLAGGVIDFEQSGTAVSEGISFTVNGITFAFAGDSTVETRQSSPDVLDGNYLSLSNGGYNFKSDFASVIVVGFDIYNPNSSEVTYFFHTTGTFIASVTVPAMTRESVYLGDRVGGAVAGFDFYARASEDSSSGLGPALYLDNFHVIGASDPIPDPPASADATSSVTTSAALTEPATIATTATAAVSKVGLLDFAITDNDANLDGTPDGGSPDANPTTVTEFFVDVSGTATDAERAFMTWHLDGPDATSVVGTYDAVTDRVTFSGLNISVASNTSETYTVSAFFNDNSGTNDVTEGHTFILSVDGDTNFTTGSGSSTMAAGQNAVTNGGGAAIDVTATQLVFSQQPSASVTSGIVFGQQPIVQAVDARGNVDTGFTGTVTLTENGSGTLSDGDATVAVNAINGVATFAGVLYTAASDADANFQLTAAASGLTSGTSNAIDPDVVATVLQFSQQPAPLTINSGEAAAFTTVPIVQAVDANGTVDTDFTNSVTLSVTTADGGTTNSFASTGDPDGGGETTVTQTASNGVVTFTGLTLQYTAGGGDNDIIALRAVDDNGDGGAALTQVDSSNITVSVNNPPAINTLAGDTLAYSEGAGAQVIDQGTGATITDGDSADFDTGTVTVSIQSGGDNAEDVLAIRNQGTGGGQIGVSGSTVTFGGTTIGTFTGGAGGNNLVVTLNANANATSAAALLQNITYQNTDTDAPTTGSRTVRFVLTDGDGGTSTNTDTTVTVSGVNDDPGITGLVSDVTVTEDTASNIDLSAAMLSDVDSGANNITLTLAAGAGSLAATSGGGVTVSGSGTGTLTLTGTASNIDSFLNTASNIQYTGAANVNGDNATMLMLTANDGGNTGNGGGTNVALGTVNIDITAVNDDPTIAGLVSDVTVTEDTASNIDLSAATFTDVDAGGSNITLTLTAGAGTLAATSGSGVTVGGTGTGTLTLTGTVSNIDSFLNTASNIQYTGASNAFGDNATTLTLAANDGGNTGTGGGTNVALGTVNIDITGVNDDPAITGLVSDVTVTEDTASNVDLSAATLTDVDSGGSNITLTLAAGAGTLAATSGGGVTVVGSGTGALTLTGTVSNIDSFLNTASNIQYSGAANVNGDNATTLTLTANDGGNTGTGGGTNVALGTVNIDITAVNDDPAITGLVSDVTVAENTASNIDLSGATLTDVDAGGSNITLTLTAGAGTLAASSGGGVTVGGSGTGTLTLTGTVSNIDTFLNTASNVQYTGPVNTTGDNATALTLTANDGGNTGTGGGTNVALGTVNIDITAVNNDPTITGLVSDVTVIEDTASNVDLSAATLSDSDSGANDITLTLTAGAGSLAATSGGGVTVSGSGTGTLTLTGTVANIDTFLNTASNIQYTGASNASGDNATTLTLTANDGGNTGAGGGTNVALGTVNIDITGVNDDPAITGLVSDVTVTEDMASNIDLSAATLTDVDSSGSNITLTLAAGAGTLAATSGGGVTAGGSGTGTLTLTGTVSNIDSFLNTASNIQYTGASNANGDNVTTLTLTANDGGNTGTGGGTNVALGAVNIDITAVNDDPAITGLVSDVTVIEDTAGNIDLSAATLSDADSGANDITLTLTAGAGTLSATGAGGVAIAGSGTNAVTLTGAVANIDAFLNNAANIQYTSALNASGDNATTLTLIANDGGNIGAGGGTNVNLGTVNIDITGVNDPPTTTGTVAAQSGTVGQAFNLDLTSFFTDIDIGDTLTFSATGLPAGLSLGSPVVSGTPTESGNFAVTLTGTDTGGASVALNFSINVAAVEQTGSGGTSTGSTQPSGVNVTQQNLGKQNDRGIGESNGNGSNGDLGSRGTGDTGTQDSNSGNGTGPDGPGNQESIIFQTIRGGDVGGSGGGTPIGDFVDSFRSGTGGSNGGNSGSGVGGGFGASFGDGGFGDGGFGDGGFGGDAGGQGTGTGTGSGTGTGTGSGAGTGTGGAGGGAGAGTVGDAGAGGTGGDGGDGADVGEQGDQGENGEEGENEGERRQGDGEGEGVPADGAEGEGDAGDGGAAGQDGEAGPEAQSDQANAEEDVRHRLALIDAQDAPVYGDALPLETLAALEQTLIQVAIPDGEPVTGLASGGGGLSVGAAFTDQLAYAANGFNDDVARLADALARAA